MPSFRKRVQACTTPVFALILLLSVSGFATAQNSKRVVPTKGNLKESVAGLKIIEVASDGAAARAGLKYGDVLIAYNRHRITTEEELEEVMRFQSNHAPQPTEIEISVYRNGEVTAKTVQVAAGRLGIFTRQWTLAGALVEDAIINRNDPILAQRYADEATISRRYTRDQILRMKLLCLNNEKDGDGIRQTQVDELYQEYLPEKLSHFANYDLIYNRRYRAAAALFKRYLKINPTDVSTQLSLASAYVETEDYDGADQLLAKIVGQSKHDANLQSEYGLSVLSDLRAKIQMGRGEFDHAQESFKSRLDQRPDDLYYTLAFLYCAARRDVNGGKPGEFDAAYKDVALRLSDADRLTSLHTDALRVFVLIKHDEPAAARAIVDKWRIAGKWGSVVKWSSSDEARKVPSDSSPNQYLPIIWRRFPGGSEIIETWNRLLEQHAVV